MQTKTALITELRARNRPSFFADPLAWAISDFAGELLAQYQGLSCDNVGLIVVSDECSLRTVRRLSEGAKNGRVSPLQFAGASPSVVAGLAAIEHKIRGPVITLTMDPAPAVSGIKALINFWTSHGDIGAVVVVTHIQLPGPRHLLRGLVARQSLAGLETALSSICGQTWELAV